MTAEERYLRSLRIIAQEEEEGRCSAVVAEYARGLAFARLCLDLSKEARRVKRIAHRPLSRNQRERLVA